MLSDEAVASPLALAELSDSPAGHLAGVDLRGTIQSLFHFQSFIDFKLCIVVPVFGSPPVLK